MSFTTKSLRQIQQDGNVLTDLADNALIYVVQGGSSYVATWATLKSILAPSPSNNDVSVGLNGMAERTIQGTIEKIRIIPNATGRVTIGTTQGGGEIFDETVTDGVPYIESLDFHIGSVTTIYFSGPSSSINVRIW